VPILRSIRLAVTAAAVSVVASPGALAAPDDKRPRPNDVPAASVETEIAPNGFQVFNNYATPERVFFPRRAVVHYVVLGIDAPPLNDDDADGVPDYVERVGDAADTAIAYFERRGFRAILPDSGGPNSRPDLYLSRFAPGTFGVAFSAARAEGGAFIAIANGLDPSAARSLASLYGIVAHELFHLVQFSYFTPEQEPAIPGWAAEGSAAAMEARVYPDLADMVATFQLRSWFDAPERSITTQTYGSQLLWYYLDTLAPSFLPAALTRLAGPPFSGDGAKPLTETFRRVTGKRFAPVFHDFALAAADAFGDQISSFRTLRLPGGYRSSVAPLAIHYVKLSMPKRGTHLVRVAFRTGLADARVALSYQLETDFAGHPKTFLQIAPRRTTTGNATVTFAIPERLRRNERFTNPMLVVTNGSPNRAARYVLSTP
jgi:hypothetical protein